MSNRQVHGRRRAIALIIVTGVVVVAAACGSDDDGGGAAAGEVRPFAEVLRSNRTSPQWKRRVGSSASTSTTSTSGNVGAVEVRVLAP